MGSRRRIMAAGRSGVPDAEYHSPAWRPDIAIEPSTIEPRTSSMDDRAIVAAVLAGDREAFRRLVDRESAGLVRACQRILGDHGEAEDVAQEAFVTAFRSLSSWRGEGPLGAWLTRIGVRMALRQAGRRKTVAWRDPVGHHASATDDPVTRATDQAALASAPLTDPAVMSLRAERATEIRTAVADLPEPYREVVAMRFFAEASLQQIADETGRPLGTVKTHLHRGLSRLRGQLEGADR